MLLIGKDGAIQSYIFIYLNLLLVEKRPANAGLSISLPNPQSPG